LKTLVLNGSPRKKGDTVSLLTELTKQLEGEVKIVSAYHDNISPCADCRYCWEHDGRSIHDDMQEVYKAVEEYDNIVIASPIYYSQLTGELLSLASRFQRYYAAKRFRGDAVNTRLPGQFRDGQGA
jgi:multimeric flavodoxin WrbA